MKKTFSIILAFLAVGTIIGFQKVNAQVDIVVKAKTPAVAKSVQPAVVMYNQGNYIGAIQILTKILETDKKNVQAQYYLALCYTRLGYKTEAEELYRKISENSNNGVFAYYSKKALNCIGDPQSEACKSTTMYEKSTDNMGNTAQQETESDKLYSFINSGKRFHAAAMDKITKERSERAMQMDEYQKKQQQAQQPMQ